MEINQELITGLVARVLQELAAGKGAQFEDGNGLFETVNDAVDAALEAQKRLIAMSLERRKQIIAAIRRATLDNNETLSSLAVRESTLGRYEDKIRDTSCALPKLLEWKTSSRLPLPATMV